MSNYQSHTITPGPSRADVIDHPLRQPNQLTLHGAVEMTQEISTRVGGGWHDGPPGPFLVLEGPIAQSEQTQRGKLSPKPGREVEARRAITADLAKDETLDLVCVPPQKTVDQVR